MRGTPRRLPRKCGPTAARRWWRSPAGGRSGLGATRGLSPVEAGPPLGHNGTGFPPAHRPSSPATGTYVQPALPYRVSVLFMEGTTISHSRSLVIIGDDLWCLKITGLSAKRWSDEMVALMSIGNVQNARMQGLWLCKVSLSK